ncbi:MAG: hypothetical protein JWQ81_6526 [Amycolatopsis sp.]|uniref:hypothetical protein n=1 Tax=Amycolatopsis sp. TaxID=37632 RepID=UPI00261EBB1E|nr:hypothetical protein [Amycolatopsis sp.]MCU1685787.1 hypothetical protein [Amycolatopsis sp.]
MDTPTTPPDIFGDRDFRATTGVDRAIAQIVSLAHPDDGFHITAPPGDNPRWARRRPKPLYSLTAALALNIQVEVRILRDIREARGEGHTWCDIGDALDLPGDDGDRASVAFDRFAPPSGLWWTCRDCTARVRDHGPDDPHPDDRESGHTADCPRHRAEVNAYLSGDE